MMLPLPGYEVYSDDGAYSQSRKNSFGRWQYLQTLLPFILKSVKC